VRLEEQRQGDGNGNADRLARALGWFSLALGVAEVVAPVRIASLVGARGARASTVQMLGAREIASGVALISGTPSRAGAWSRVAGDAMDLALLGAAFGADGANRRRLAFSAAAVAGIAALDIACSKRLGNATSGSHAGVDVTKSIAINRPPEEVYGFWRNFENLPRFMKHVESVKVTGDGKSHWVARAPLGSTVEWDALVVAEVPNELIAWRSVEGADVYNEGTVRFVSEGAGRGTLVLVELRYFPPAGELGASVAAMLGEEPEWQVKDDLRRFKQVMETGEVITTEGQPAGRERSTSWMYDTATRK